LGYRYQVTQQKRKIKIIKTKQKRGTITSDLGRPFFSLEKKNKIKKEENVIEAVRVTQ
jgi:hypothetical protein